MKKLIVIGLMLLFISTGCTNKNNEDLIKDFTKSVKESKSYVLKGKMEISNGEEKFIYDLESSHLDDDYYKVVLVNESNNHEQIILKNNEGVYVITPSLNKSFKFDSVWPHNSSQSYILETLVTDISNNDKDVKLEKKDNGYELRTVVNYPNNKNLEYQILKFDKKMNIVSVDVYDNNDNIIIKVKFNDINLKAKLKEEDFGLENYVKENACEEDCDEATGECENSCTLETSGLDSAIYPLYIPGETSLTSSETIKNETTDRIILTFGGAKNFVLIEEVSTVFNEHEVIPINGNPLIINDTVGALGTNSIHFTKNNIDYYLVSNDLTNEEMVSVASSVGNIRNVVSTK